MGPARETVLLLADSDVRCRVKLRRFFSKRGFLVLATGDGLRCLDELVAMEPDVLVIALDLPWGGGDGVIARLHDGLPTGKTPIIFVIGEALPKTLSARTGVAQCNCFSKPVSKERLLDRIGTELAVRRRGAGHGAGASKAPPRRMRLALGTRS